MFPIGTTKHMQYWINMMTKVSLIVVTWMLCGALGCPDPGTPRNGARHPPETATPTEFAVHAVLRFTCDDGYLLDGPPKIICTKSGAWLPPHQPSCVAMHPCSPNPCQNGATCVDTSLTSTGTQRYRCHCPPAYHGNHCEQRMDCQLPPDSDVPNSHYSVEGQMSDSTGWYLPGTTLHYQCDPGFIAHGATSTRQCQSGQWVGELPECVKEQLCEDPGKPDHSKRCCQSIFSTGVRVSFYCDEGYQLIGDDERTCQADGTWSGLQPSCVKATTDPTIHGTNMFNTETLTIVTATTGSILGVLVITVILTSRQCCSQRHHGRRCYPTVLQARLARIHHDSDALLAVSDNIDVVLPTYDEAMAPVVTVRPRRASTEDAANSESTDQESRSAVQGRPLPPLPPPTQGRATRSRRTRGSRNSTSAETDTSPLLETSPAATAPPPPYQSEPAPASEEVPEPDGEVPHSHVGNDLYAEVSPRRAEVQGDGAHISNSTDNQESVCDNGAE
ncbi:sushi domain-containing protein 4-like isoform X1 [Diadema antillarum]|uniref:sushi domain-containing protein 4-like isoform X1 n=2 Tax=Diadema antillarum TaxID=105358 RepID=UPI003A8923B1